MRIAPRSPGCGSVSTASGAGRCRWRSCHPLALWRAAQGRSRPRRAAGSAPPRPAGAPLTPAGSWPSPVFRPGGRSEASSGVGAVQAGEPASHPQGLALTTWSPPRCYTVIPPGRAGVLACRESPGEQTGARAPPAAQGRRGAAEGEDGDGAGGRGLKSQQGAAAVRCGAPRGLRSGDGAAERKRCAAEAARTARTAVVRCRPRTPAPTIRENGLDLAVLPAYALR